MNKGTIRFNLLPETIQSLQFHSTRIKGTSSIKDRLISLAIISSKSTRVSSNECLQGFGFAPISHFYIPHNVSFRSKSSTYQFGTLKSFQLVCMRLVCSTSWTLVIPSALKRKKGRIKSVCIKPCYNFCTFSKFPQIHGSLCPCDIHSFQLHSSLHNQSH